MILKQPAKITFYKSNNFYDHEKNYKKISNCNVYVACNVNIGKCSMALES